MPTFLDTRDEPSLAIAICDRCKRKRPIGVLGPDGNSPGLRVCLDGGSHGCWDSIDPYRLPPVQPDVITINYPRPDVNVTPDSVYLQETESESGPPGGAWLLEDGLGAWIIG